MAAGLRTASTWDENPGRVRLARALADLDREDGSFHSPEITDAYHPGFERHDVRGRLSAAGFDDLEDATAFVHRRNDRDYPVFLITGRVR